MLSAEGTLGALNVNGDVTMDLDTAMVIGLVAVPFAAAILAAALGPARANLIRWLSLGATLTGLALAIFVTLRFTAIRAERPALKEPAPTFRPEMVPGADANSPHATTWRIIEFGRLGAVQFYLGVDGMNIWLIGLTAL